MFRNIVDISLPQAPLTYFALSGLGLFGIMLNIGLYPMLVYFASVEAVKCQLLLSEN